VHFGAACQWRSRCPFGQHGRKRFPFTRPTNQRLALAGCNGRVHFDSTIQTSNSREIGSSIQAPGDACVHEQQFISLMTCDFSNVSTEGHPTLDIAGIYLFFLIYCHFSPESLSALSGIPENGLAVFCIFYR
jgi:hypothetical protein